MTKQEKRLHGWYSERMSKIFGTSWYVRKNGSEVELTNISDSSTDSDTKWPDIEYRGVVVRWLRDGLRGEAREWE